MLAGRRILFVCVLSLSAGSAEAAASPPATRPTDSAAMRPPAVRAVVDPRVELMSIIFRLAGNSEYNMPNSQSAYSRDVQAYFGPFAEHPAVVAARKLRKTRGVSYDAVMAMAVHISDAAQLNERVPFDKPGHHLDSRWRVGAARDFLAKARAFATDSRFAEFIDKHQDLYAEAAANLDESVGNADLKQWFDAYFGTRGRVEFRLVVGMLNGGGCYGCRCTRPDGALELYSIIGAWKFDSRGVPVWPMSATMGAVHEFGHSYCNPLIDKHLAGMRAAGDKLFESRAEQMRKQAYGTGPTVLYESLVRAVCVRYAHSTGGSTRAAAELRSQTGRGFVWVPDLADLLAEYEADRGRYPTLDAFMPRVVEFFNEYAETVKPEKKSGWLDRLLTSQPRP